MYVFFNLGIELSKIQMDLKLIKHSKGMIKMNFTEGYSNENVCY